MKIAVNARFLLPGQLEGIGWVTHEVVRRMVAAHPEDEFFLLFDRPYDQRFVFGPNVRPVVVGPPARHPLLFAYWYEWRLPGVLADIGADVFLSFDNFLSLRTDVPTILMVHDLAYLHFPEQVSWLVRRYYRYFTPRYLHRADHIFAVSDFTRQDILQHFALEPGKVETVHNGCRPGFAPLSEAEREAVRRQYADGQPYFFYYGALQPRKNIVRLMEAFSLFNHITSSSYKLLLGGRLAWQTKDIQRARRRTMYREDIRFLGYIPERELPRLLGGAFALTYVSLFEGFGLPVLEAMHSEVPVITSNLSSMPEIAGAAALLVDPYNVASINIAMRKIWRDDRVRQRLVEAGRKQRELFDWERSADIIYKEVKRLGMAKSR